jgi:hypothetical protein
VRLGLVVQPSPVHAALLMGRPFGTCQPNRGKGLPRLKSNLEADDAPVRDDGGRHRGGSRRPRRLVLAREPPARRRQVDRGQHETQISSIATPSIPNHGHGGRGILRCPRAPRDGAPLPGVDLPREERLHLRPRQRGDRRSQPHQRRPPRPGLPLRRHPSRRLPPLRPLPRQREPPVQRQPRGCLLLGWVDLWRGILLCDVLSENPKLQYISQCLRRC